MKVGAWGLDVNEVADALTEFSDEHGGTFRRQDRMDHVDGRVSIIADWSSPVLDKSEDKQ